jgi:fumarate hydratase, class I
MYDLTNEILELIRMTSTDLPGAVETKLAEALKKEKPGSAASVALETILSNVRIAREKSIPICQDTGTLTFYVQYPTGWSTGQIETQIFTAVDDSIRLNYLRPLAKDRWMDDSPGEHPDHSQAVILHFDEAEDSTLQIDLILKGGGCENVSTQFALPDSSIHAGRDLDGVRKAALQAVFQAQGKGCSPGFLGIAVGGDRGTGYEKAKSSLLRSIGDANPIPALADLEDRITREGNELGIGPMGFGGRSTILGTKISASPRLPASFFVSISYMCWAYRHRVMWMDGSGTHYK